MPGEVVVYEQFEFRGDRLQLLADDRGRFVSFSRACSLLGLDPAAQWDRIRRMDAIAAQSRIEFNAATGRPMYYLRVEAVPMWLGTLESEALPAAYRAKHTAYCLDLISAVYDYTTKGVAIKAGTPPLQVIQSACEFLLKIDPSEKAQLTASAAMQSQLAVLAGRAGDAERPYTVVFRCAELGYTKLDAEDHKRIGVAVAREYRRAHGREPAKFRQDIKGRLTLVNSYREKDLPLIDAEIRRYVAAR